MFDKIMYWLLARFPKWLVFSFVGVLGLIAFVGIATAFMLFIAWYIQVPGSLNIEPYNLKVIFGMFWFGIPVGAAMGNMLFFDTHQRKSKDDE